MLLKYTTVFQRGGIKDKLMTVSVYNPGNLYILTFDL